MMGHIYFLMGAVRALLSDSELSCEKQDWNEHIVQFVDSWQRAKNVRGRSYGYYLSGITTTLMELINPHQRAQEPVDLVACKIGKKIKELRKECAMSFDELAQAIGIDKKQLVLHAEGRARPRPRTLREYAQAFTKILKRQVSPADFEK
jgi:DNA-binding XRE family transcriptional regulator